MVTFIDNTIGGYLTHIKIENESMLMLINVEWWFPNTQKKVDALFKIMYANDFTYNIGNVLDKLIYKLDKMYNGLYGGSERRCSK